MLTKIQNFIEIQSSRFRWYSFVFARTQSRLVIMCNSFPGSSFSENFYGMKRVAVSCDATNDTDGESDVSRSSTGTESDQEQPTASSTLYHSLPKSNMYKSLLFLVSRDLYLSYAYFAENRQLWSLNIFYFVEPHHYVKSRRSCWPLHSISSLEHW